MRTAVRPVLLLALALVLSACRVHSTVDIEVRADGGGQVAVTALFDAAATEALDGLADRLFLSDLSAAGWTVEPIESRGDGTTLIVVAKPFSNQAGLQTALDEIAGPGVFQNVRISADDAFAQRRQSLSFDIDLSDGWALFSDDGVAEELDGEPFGVPIGPLTDGRTIDEIVTVEVRAAVAATPDASDNAASVTVTPRFDADAPTPVAVEASVEQSLAIMLRWVTWALAALAALSIVLFLLGLVMRRSAERRRAVPTPGRLASRIPGGGEAVAAPTSPRGQAASVDEQPVRLVIVEPRSVFFETAATIESEVLTFVRDHGGDARADFIADALANLLVGRIDSGDVWIAAELGETHDDVADLDAAFVERRVLRRSTPRLLRDLGTYGIGVAAITSDATSWADATREAHRMHDIEPWLVSGTLGSRQPDSGMFERLRRTSGIAYRHCVYVDTKVENLDVARELGMRTALYAAPDVVVPDIPGHPVVSDLATFARRLHARGRA